MACFTDINVLQGNVAIFARCGETFDIRLTANLQRNFPVNFFNRLRIDRIMVMSLCGPFFLVHPVRLSRLGWYRAAQPLSCHSAGHNFVESAPINDCIHIYCDLQMR